MYIVVLVILLIGLGLGFLASPILAVIVAVPLFLIFLAYVGWSRREDETGDPTPGASAHESPVAGTARESHGGIWGEKTRGGEEGRQPESRQRGGDSARE